MQNWYADIVRFVTRSVTRDYKDLKKESKDIEFPPMNLTQVLMQSHLF